MAEYEFIETEQRGAVLIARFNRPPRNIMHAPMVAELSQLLDEQADDEATRAIILTGAIDGWFIQHYDVAELLATAEAARANAELGKGPELHGTHQAYLKIESLDKPVIAAINGVAQGGGFELTLACDFRYMAIGGRVGLPEVNVGILPGAGGTQRLARLIGVAKATDLIMRGQVVDAETAERLGMVHRAIEPEKLMDESIALAEQLAALPAKSLALVKQCLRQGIEMPLFAALRLEEDAFWKAMRTDDAARLMQAYVDEGQLGNL